MSETMATTRVRFDIRTSEGEQVSAVGDAAVVEFLIGRKSLTAVQGDRVFIHDKFMSRKHCRVYRSAEDGLWYVQDLNSANGTRLGGSSLTEPVALRGGEELRVGTAVLRIALLDEAGAAQADTRSSMTQPPPAAGEPMSDTIVAAPGDGGRTSMLLAGGDETVPSVRAREDDPTQFSARAGADPTEFSTARGGADATEFSGDEQRTSLSPQAADGETLARVSAEPPPADDTTAFSARADAPLAGGEFLDTIAASEPLVGDDSQLRPTELNPEEPPVATPAGEQSLADDDSQLRPTELNPEEQFMETLVTEQPLADDDARARPTERAPADAPDGVRTAPPDRTVPPDAAGAGGADARTVPPEGGRSAPPTDRARESTTAGSVTASDDMPTRLETEPADEAGLSDDIPTALAGNEVVRVLLAQQLLDGYQVNQILREARSEGMTFFRAYVEREDTRQHYDQIYPLVAELRGLECINDVDRLYDRSLDAPWLRLELAERLGIIALADQDDDATHFAVGDPYDVTVRDWVRHATGKRAVPHLAYPNCIKLVIQRLRNRSSAGGEDHDIVAVDVTEDAEEDLREHLADADAPQIVNYFIHQASRQGASDIHIEPTEERLVVRVRVDGVLHQDVALPSAYHAVVASRLKIMSGMDVAEKRRPQDGRIGVVVRGNPIDVRVSTYPTVYGEKIVMRLLDKNALRPSPETLGLLPRDLRVLKDAISAPYGLIMLCGPTGSGKTTTLYSCLGAIDKAKQNVLTVEDPVEYRLGGVHQMQVNSNIGLTFASGLRTILRQDPDVIMVGECRDPETASMAIQASLTGHVVFSTIHTNDAVGVVTRLIDMGIVPFLVGSPLSVAIAQRLVRVLCPDCKVPVTGEEVLAQLAQDGVSDEKLAQLHIDVDPFLDYAEARGCRQCRNTGYIGRRAVFEVFEIDREARSLIASEEFTDARLREHAQRKGMTTLVSHGLKLVEDEDTTFAEVIRVLGETN